MRARQNPWPWRMLCGSHTRPIPRSARKLAGFIAEMRKVAMKLHTKEQAPKEGGKEAPKQGPVSLSRHTRPVGLVRATRTDGEHRGCMYALSWEQQLRPYCPGIYMVGPDSFVCLAMWLDPATAPCHHPVTDTNACQRTCHGSTKRTILLLAYSAL